MSQSLTPAERAGLISILESAHQQYAAAIVALYHDKPITAAAAITAAGRSMVRAQPLVRELEYVAATAQREYDDHSRHQPPADPDADTVINLPERARKSYGGTI